MVTRTGMTWDLNAGTVTIEGIADLQPAEQILP